MPVKRMSTYTRKPIGAGLDEWGDHIPNAGVTLPGEVPDFAPVWESPTGERVPITFRTPRTREAAIERVARQIAHRPELVIGWQFSNCTGAVFLRFRGWRLLPDDTRPAPCGPS